MNAQQWLDRARGIDKEINNLLRTRRETRDRLLKITQSYVKDTVSGSKDPHKFDRLVEIESMIDEEIDKQLEVKKEITEAVMKLEDRKQRQVLLSYFVRCVTLERIAVEMKYSYKQIKRIKRDGIAEVERRMQAGEYDGRQQSTD